MSLSSKTKNRKEADYLEEIKNSKQEKPFYEGKYLAVKSPNAQRFVRLRSLSETNYLSELLAAQKEREAAEKKKQEKTV